MRFDDIGMFWEDIEETRSRGARTLGPMPPIPDTGWTPPQELPNIIDAPWIGVDCETYDPELIDHGPGWGRGKGHICGVSIAVPWGKWYFPIRHTVQPELNLDPGRVLSWLRYSLAGRQPKIGAHLLYDIGWLAQEGVTVNGPLYDVQYAEGLIDESARVSLETLGWKYLKRGKLKDELKEWIMGYYRPPEQYWRREIYRSPVAMVGPYAEEDAAMPYEILDKQWPVMVHRGLLELFFMECKLINLLVAMRFQGITVDIAKAEIIRDRFSKKVDMLHAEAERIAGVSFSATAPDSIAIAFEKLGLTYPRTRTGRPSFTADGLKVIKHPFAQLISSERHLKKLISTFLDGYILDAHVNHKVYCSFHPMVSSEGGAKTGRFSSSDPNLQNIPVRTEEGRIMREMFTHDYGHKCYRSGDYSQIEYRMLAHFATGHHSIPGSYEAADDVRARYTNDPSLDYHEMISTLINEIAHIAIKMKNGAVLSGSMIDGVPLVREHIKTLNFACVYGVGKEHLTEMLGVVMAVAMQVQAAFHKAVPFAKSTMNAISDEVGKTGICTTVLNRQTHFDMWEAEGWGRSHLGKLPYQAALAEYGPNIRRADLYAALNYRLQGSAADVMKKAMVDCWDNGVFSYTGVPRITCHDELGFSDPGNVPDDAWNELVHTMENTIPFRVPIRFDFKSGNNWRECK